MTDGGKRLLPPIPNAHHLRKQAKARLAAMRARWPSARLADAQHALAHEYGFAGWAALQQEVSRRACSPLALWGRIRRMPVAVYRSGYRAPPLADEESEAMFLRLGLSAPVGFVFVVVALVGASLPLLASHLPHAHVPARQARHPFGERR